MLFGVLTVGAVPPRQKDTTTLQDRLLKLVNAERSRHGAPPLALDDLAGRVAQDHARDMAAHKYLSHWGRDGRKPYMRYAFAGGIDGNAENVAQLTGGPPSLSDEDLWEYVADLHRSMYEEKPPNDGHRRTILNPYHTHVGFGIAQVGGEVRLVEEYLSRYVEVAPLPARGKPGAKFELVGRTLDKKIAVHGVEVGYEPLPTPPSLDWLRTTRSYSLPDKPRTLRPRLSFDRLYVDGSRGDVDIDGKGNFRAPIRLYESVPGIYTVIVWVRDSKDGAPFPVTNLCIQAE